uniref:Uncharacterized protein n=1 Tax=Phage sp. ct4bw6 TaxID=2826747 RepID=A0A8S5MVK8_9VIRU|nr:MAG TPA: hypothetical protein [Phage sp. ct4bw6]
MPCYRRTTAVREVSSSRTTARRESGEIVARQGKGVSGEVVQRGSVSGDACGFVLSYAAPVRSVTHSGWAGLCPDKAEGAPCSE